MSLVGPAVVKGAGCWACRRAVLRASTGGGAWSRRRGRAPRDADDVDRAFAREWDAVFSSARTVVVGEGEDSSDSACTGQSSFVKRARAENRARPLYPLCFLPFSARQTLAFTVNTIKHRSRQGRARTTLRRSSVRAAGMCADSLSPSPSGLMESERLI